MKETGLSTRQLYFGTAALLILYILSVSINLGMTELEGEEPRRAIVSLEMMHAGKYLNPTQFGWPYYNKPPLYNWILIGFIKLFHSSSEAVLRLPSLLFYLMWAGVHYRFSKKYFSAQAALLSALFLLTSGDIYFYGLANGAEIDVFYSFLVYLQVIAIFHYFQKRKWLSLYWLSYLLCALGFLTKGFPSLVFEGLTLVALCIFARSVKPLFNWQHLAGILVFAALTGLYFWGYSVEGDLHALLINLLNESLAKSAIGERSHKVFEKAVGYPFLLLKLVAPWSLLLLLLFVKRVRQQVGQNPFTRFSLLFILCNLWVYWLSGQPKARYIYMFAPFAITLFVQLLQSFMLAYAARMDNLLRWFGLIFLFAAAALFVLPFGVTVSQPLSWIAAVIMTALAWYFFKGNSSYRLWAFVTGVILVRLIYALVFIPFQDRQTAYYEAPVKQAAAAFGKAPITYWAPPQVFVVAIQTSLFSWRADTLQAPKPFPSQVPYYYYRYTGKLMQYDTLAKAGRNYVSYTTDLLGRSVDTVMQLAQKREPNILLLYRLR